jgi:hypothetical protein
MVIPVVTLLQLPHGQQEQGGNDADAKFHMLPPLLIDLSLNRFSLGGFDTANKIKAAQKACQKKPRLVRKSDRTHHYKTE